MTVGNSKPGKSRAAHLGPERRRPAALDAALRLAVERGLRGVSMDAVAQALGVTRPVIYACYASREELLTALLAREEEKLFAGVLAALPRSPSFRDPERLLIEGFRALLSTVAAHADSWQLVFAADPDPAIADRYGQARRIVATRVAELMAPGLATHGVTDIARKLPVLVELFMSIGDGAVRALLQGSRNADTRAHWSPEDLGEFVGRIAWGALQRAQAPEKKPDTPATRS